METATSAEEQMSHMTEEQIKAENGVIDDNHMSPSHMNGDYGNDGPDPCKMFIGGLSWQTTADSLREHFGKYGELSECMVMRDPATRRARGFGFITFAESSGVERVMAAAQHDLDGKKIDPKPAFPKQKQAKMITRTKKIFIGGLSATSSVDDMKAYFEQFGKIEDAMLMFDKSTQRHRGFGFVTFESEDVVEKVCEIHFHEINGKMVECKKAQPKEVMLPVQLNKSRAAAARSLYGMAPEQLLAQYAQCLQPARFGAYGAANLYYPMLNGYATAGQFTPTSPTSVNGGQRPLTGLEALYAPVDMSQSYHAAATSPQGYAAQQQAQQAFNAAPQLIASYNGFH